MRDEISGFPPLLSERYTIERFLGRGGMATVYLARDPKHDRRVAVKVLHPELSRDLGAERFLREIRIAARLTHPHILPLYDSGQVGDLLFYVMPFVVGESLRDRLARERQLPVDVALRIACEVAGALQHAHAHGVVHRDIKPENILLDGEHALLADFGIARAIGSGLGERITSTGLTLGTPAYMSPEQVESESALDGRSDVYGLACVLYEMLAGEPPFTGPTAHAIIAKRLGGPPPRIRTVRPTVPPAVEEVLLCALEPVPADRFESAERFRAALVACEGRGGRLPPPPTVTGRKRHARRWAIAAASLALPLAPLGIWWGAGGFGGDTAPTLAVLPLANVSSDPAHAFLADGLTDALIGDLARTPGLRVISHTSVMRFASAMSGGGMDMGMGAMDAPEDMSGGMAPMGPPRSLAEIASELNADLVMQGTFAHTGDSVRVSATVVDPALQRSVWTAVHVRHARDLFALQQDLVRAVASVVGRGGGGESLAPGRQYDPAAHEAYLKGAYYQAHWNLPAAIASFERAVELDPTHAPAHAGLSRVYYFRAFFGDMAPGIAFGAMRRAATAALELDPLLAEAHAQLALVKMLQEWDWAGAELSFRRALELSPDDAQIRHDYAHFLLAQGRHRESLAETAKAVAFDPANPMLTSCLGWHSLFDERHDQAVVYAAEAHTMMPDSWAQVVLGWALLGKGEHEPALAALREATRLTRSAFAEAALAHGLAVSGRAAEARDVLAGLLRRVEAEYVSPYDIASVYAGLGERDEAFKWLRRAAEDRSTFIVHLGWDARFGGLRDDDRYRQLLEQELQLRMPLRTTSGTDL